MLEALLERKLCASLERVEQSLRRWRAGELRPFDVHAELLDHNARIGRMAKRVARANADMLRTVLRDAFDEGLIERDAFVELVGETPEAVEPSRSVDDDAAWSAHKRELVEDMLNTGPVLVHLDTRVEGVEVPSQFHGQARLVLRFGYKLSPPIVDMDVSEFGIHGTLTFGGQPFRCAVPWGSLYAVVAESDGQGMVWAEDMPDEILAELGAASGDAESSSPPPQPVEATPEKPKPRASHLKLVE